MPTELVDLFQLQLSQQAMLYDLTYMSGRRRSAERVSEFFLHMQSLLPVTTVLEIGAHEAAFSRAVKKVCPEKTVRAFEANPHVYAHFLLERELRALGVDYRYGAIGAQNGSTRFHIYETIDGREEPCDSRRQSTLRRIAGEKDRCHGVWVPLSRLDTLCATDPEESRYALWIDAEGSGGQVLEGAEGILAKTLAVYMELESQPKFEGQELDRDIMRRLLERDFIPVLRDFQFHHQYNAVFVKKDCLPLVEREWHRYFQSTLRQDLRTSFRLEVLPKRHTPVAPPPLPRLRFGSVGELREAMEELPLLRAPRAGLDPRHAVVVCHVADLDEAVRFYRRMSDRLPEFYALTADGERVTRNDIACHDFARLAPGMDIQLYCRQNVAPGKTFFPYLCIKLQKIGIRAFHIERYCTEHFFRRNRHETFTDQDWDIVLNFTNRLCDADSQYSYMAVCRARLGAEPGYIPLAGYRQYFHPRVHAQPGDIICEGGCFAVCEQGVATNSSTLNFYEAMHGQGMIFGFEPVTATYEKLQTAFAPHEGIRLIAQALWSGQGRLQLEGDDAAAFTHDMAGGSGNCDCTSVDAFFADKAAPTLIKLDVEGAESEVMQGAQRTITQHLPKLMLSIYHGRRGPDWLTLPRMLLEHDLPYEYYCGHHRPWYSESIVYAQKGVV